MSSWGTHLTRRTARAVGRRRYEFPTDSATSGTWMGNPGKSKDDEVLDYSILWQGSKLPALSVRA
eukprot:4094460-Pyramimonas_sp.AAC.1